MVLELIDKRIIELLDKNCDCLYELVGDTIVAYNRIKKYQKLNLNYYEMIIDEFVYNTNIKNTKLYKHYDIEEFYYQERKYYYLKLKLLDIINTQEDFEDKLEEIKISNKKPSLLLHSCCGPCSSYVLEYLNEYFDITMLFYNPNIDTNEEFLLRLDNLYKIIDSLGLKINVLCPKYNHQRYLDYIKGYEDCNEGEKRCYFCYEERMDCLAQMAKDKFDYFTSTLSISPYKNSDWLNEIGIRMQEKYNVKYLYANFKLHNGYKRSIELSKKYNLYRQDYCGCEFSKK